MPLDLPALRALTEVRYPSRDDLAAAWRALAPLLDRLEALEATEARANRPYRHMPVPRVVPQPLPRYDAVFEMGGR